MKLKTGIVFLLQLLLMLIFVFPALAAKQEGKTLADLSPAAQMAVSETIGRDDASYHATRIADGYQLGGKQELTAQFRADGATVSGWRLALAGVGRGDALKAPSAAPPTVTANRVEYRRGDVTEWYINGPLGLEQGFTLQSAPQAAGTGPLSLALRLPENMQADIADNRTDVSLTIQGTVQPLKYGRLAAWDATGKSLTVWFEIARSGATQALHIRVDDNGAHYPVTIDPMIELQKLTASDSAVTENFGYSVSLSSDGNTALIGDTASNSAYVFIRSGTTWNQQQKLVASDPSGSYTLFGCSVSLSGDGNTALIGASGDNQFTGAAYVFVRNGTAWSQQGNRLTASDVVFFEYFGCSVSLSGDGNTALIGASEKNSSRGAAYVFVRSGETWSQQGSSLTVSDAAANDYFGSSVSLSGDGNTALIGAYGKNFSKGAAYIFVRSGTTWSQQGSSLTFVLISTNDYFGSSVSLSSDGNTALIGAYGTSFSRGAAYLFTRSGFSWNCIEWNSFLDTRVAAGDRFGWSVSLSGDGTTALIGTSSSSPGGAYVFAANSGWRQQGGSLVASDVAAGNNFGSAVGLSGDGNIALIGAYGKNSSYVFNDLNVCEAGNYYNGTACTPCAAGSYQTRGFNLSCITAPAGFYVSSPGSSSATACAAGTFQSLTGQTACTDCPMGSYQPSTGQSACISAPAGTFVDTTGATTPTACPAGTFQSGTGANSCTVCAAGTLQPAIGQSACVAIPKASTSIVIDPTTTPNTLYVAIDSEGVYKSTDGATWNAANGATPNNLTNLRVKVLARAASGTYAGTIYAASYGNGLFKSTDSAASWSACGTTGLTNLNLVSLTIDVSGKLYAGSEAGVFMSTDGCATWTAINGGLP